MRLETPSSDRAAEASLRPAAPGDLTAVQSIYGFYVARSTATFEETLPDLDEMAQRFEAIVGRGLPFLVAEAAGSIAGFAYAAPFRQRSAYRYTVEDSIYVRDGMDGRGIGRALLAAVIDACEALDCRQMIAVIGDFGQRPFDPIARRPRFPAGRNAPRRRLQVRALDRQRLHATAAWRRRSVAATGLILQS